MVAPKGRFQSRDGYVRSMAKLDARRMVQEDMEMSVEPVNRTARHDEDEIPAPRSRLVPTAPPPPLPIVLDEPRPGWLRSLWQRLLRLFNGKRRG
jgi:hypothetical protein